MQLTSQVFVLPLTQLVAARRRAHVDSARERRQPLLIIYRLGRLSLH